MRKLIIVFLFILSFCLSVYGQNEIVLTGFYLGKNAYVSNPRIGADSAFCTAKVLVNNKEIKFENNTTYEIDLKLAGLKLGDSLSVIIIYKNGCKPKVINPEFCIRRSNLELKSIEVSREGRIRWKTKNETSNFPFIVEKFVWDKWTEVGQAESKGGMENTYELKVDFHPGINRFRIRQDQNKGQWIVYSRTIEYTSTIGEITFSVDQETKQIIFSSETRYELLDNYGNSLRKGKGKTIDCSSFTKGTYFLNYSNSVGEVRFKWK